MLGDHPGLVTSWEYPRNGRDLDASATNQTYHFSQYLPDAERLEDKKWEIGVLQYDNCKCGWGARYRGGERGSKMGGQSHTDSTYYLQTPQLFTPSQPLLFVSARPK